MWIKIFPRKDWTAQTDETYPFKLVLKITWPIFNHDFLNKFRQYQPKVTEMLRIL